MVLTGCSTSTRSTTNRNCYQFLTGPHTIISRGYSIILILHQSRLLIPLKWLFPSHALSISHSQHLWTGTCLIWPPHPVHSHRIKKIGCISVVTCLTSIYPLRSHPNNTKTSSWMSGDKSKAPGLVQEQENQVERTTRGTVRLAKFE